MKKPVYVLLPLILTACIVKQKQMDRKNIYSIEETNYLSNSSRLTNFYNEDKKVGKSIYNKNYSPHIFSSKSKEADAIQNLRKRERYEYHSPTKAVHIEKIRGINDWGTWETDYTDTKYLPTGVLHFEVSGHMRIGE